MMPLICSFMIVIVVIIFFVETQYRAALNRVHIVEDIVTSSALGALAEDTSFMPIYNRSTLDEEKTYEHVCRLIKENLDPEGTRLTRVDNSFHGETKLVAGDSHLSKVWIYYYDDEMNFVCAQYGEGGKGSRRKVADLHRTPTGEEVNEIGVYVEYTFPIKFLEREIIVKKGNLVNLWTT